jgi:hypothetical protein
MEVPELYQDNKSAIDMMTTGIGKVRTKHLRTRKYRVKEYVDNGNLKVIHCSTEKMIADVLTKPLQGSLFKRLTAELNGTNRFDFIV